MKKKVIIRKWQYPPELVILHLTLTAKWFDRIKSGRKRYEFREAKEYWYKRLVVSTEIDEDDIKKPIRTGKRPMKAKHYDIIRFKNGYQRDARWMTVEFKGCQLRRYKGKWYFVIELGKILKSNV